MRRSVYVLLSILCSCGVSNNPRDVAEHFLKASINMDFKEARKYATPETASMLDFVQNITAKTNAKRNALKNIDIEMGEENVNGENAIVAYTKKGSKEKYHLNLIRINGKWLVSAGVKDLNNEGDEDAGEQEYPAVPDSAKD